MTTKQIIRIYTATGVEEIDADRLLVQNAEYVLLRGDEEIRRVKIADIVQSEEHDGIETIYSRS
jgi:hypothetical protein